MKRITVVALAALLAVIVSTQAGARTNRSAARSITLVSVKEVPGHLVQATVRITGWRMIPSKVSKKPNSATGGHWHIFVNGKYNNYSANATKGTTLKLKKGDYKITAALANDDHSPVKGTHPTKAISVMVDG